MRYTTRQGRVTRGSSGVIVGAIAWSLVMAALYTAGSASFLWWVWNAIPGAVHLPWLSALGLTVFISAVANPTSLRQGVR